MAYMNQEKKKVIAAELKRVIPPNWKYSLAVRNGSTIVLTIRKAPIKIKDDYKQGYETINHHYPENHFEGELLETFEKIITAMNINNYDNSDVYTDYFDVGYYIDIQLGSWDKPFISTLED